MHSLFPWGWVIFPSLPEGSECRWCQLDSALVGSKTQSEDWEEHSGNANCQETQRDLRKDTRNI